MQDHPHSHQTPPSRHLWKALGQFLLTRGQAVARFMVHRPPVPAQPEVAASQPGYDAKARFYAYLPVSEEQRDWLNKLYYQS